MRTLPTLSAIDAAQDPEEKLCLPAAAAHARSSGPIGWRCNTCLRDYSLEHIDANGRCPKCTARAAVGSVA